MMNWLSDKEIERDDGETMARRLLARQNDPELQNHQAEVQIERHQAEVGAIRAKYQGQAPAASSEEAVSRMLQMGRELDQAEKRKWT